MRVAFLGTPDCAVPTLRALVDHGHDVPLVITRPDRPRGRSGTPQPPPVKRFALTRGLEVLQPRGLVRERIAERLAGLRLDALVVVAYGKILRRAMLAVPRLAPINVHFSLLPRYRGAAPVQWALANGERRTGVTTMHISEGLDEGDVLLQRAVDIEPGVHAPELLDRLAAVGAPLLIETLELLEAGRLTAVAQDPAQATYAPMLQRRDGEIAPELEARAIADRIRGFDPWPGVWLKRGGRRLRLLEAEALPGVATGARPGVVVELSGDALIVACGNGTRLALRRLQPEGKRAISAREAVNGRQLAPGDRLEASQPS